MTRLLVRAAATAASVLLLASWGSAPPGEQAPALTKELSAIDDALAQSDYARAQEHLQKLVAAAEDARAAGDLDDDDADRVLAAAARLLAELPGAPDTTATPEPSTEPSTPEPTSESTTPAPSDVGGGSKGKPDKPPKPDKGKPKGGDHGNSGKGKGKG